MISQNNGKMEDVEDYTVQVRTYVCSNAERHANICTTAVAGVDVITSDHSSFIQ